MKVSLLNVNLIARDAVGTVIINMARFFRRRGTVAFGMAVFDDRLRFGDLLSMFHGNDERVSEASLGLTADHLALTVTRFGERIR